MMMTTKGLKLRRQLFFALPSSIQGFAFRVLTGGTGRRRQFERTHVGAGTYVDPTVQILGWKNVRIGRNSVLSEDTWLNVNMRHTGMGRISIGDNVHVGRRNFFSAGPLIELRDYCFTGIGCNILGCGHDIRDPRQPYIASGLDEGGPVVIGTNCWLATAVTIMQNVHVGYGSVVGACSLVTKDVPPFSVGYGSPFKVVKRFDFQSNQWLRIQDWNHSLEAAMPTEEEYRLALSERVPSVLPALNAASSTFGWL